MAEGLLDQYREKLKKAIGTARFYGLPDRPLEKVFVELTVIEDFEIPRDAEYKALMDKELRRRRTLFPKDETEEDDNPEATDEESRKRPRKVRRTVKPEELLEAGKRSQVVGAPGCGKTTLLRWLALQTTKTSDRLPVFIELKRLQNDQFNTLNKGFSKFLFENGVSFRFDPAETPSKELELLESEFNKLFASGRLVVLLDGLDEVAETERHRLRTAVENYANQRDGGLTLIVSTRPYGYLRNFADLKAMEIEPLSDIQMGQFLDHWCEKTTAETVKANLRKNPNLRSLARFPFLLAFIANLNSGGDISRIDLYRKIVSELINTLDKDKSAKKLEVDDPDGVLKPKFLKQFAFAQLFEKQEAEISSRLVFDTEEIFKAAKAFLKEEDPDTSPRHFVHDLCATPLFRAVEENRYAFAHLTIQEFLAAEELSKRDDCHEQFSQAFFNRQLAEMEVLPMTIGLAEKPNELYELLSKIPESFDFVRLCLEARSFGYHQKAVPDANYQKWRKRLAVFGLRKIQGEDVFSVTVLNSFISIEKQHFNNLISDFLTGLGDQDTYVRQRTADALGKLGNASPDVIRALSDTLRDQDQDVHRRAADALVQLGNVSTDVIRVLSEALRDQEWYVRQRAAEALGKLGNASTDVIRALSEALRDQEWSVSQNAANALIQLGNLSTDVIHVLSQALRDQEWYVRQRAAEALGKLGNASTDVIHALSESLRDQDQDVRQRAADALGKLGNATTDVIHSLSESLRDQDQDVRQSAAEALVQLGNISPDVIRILSDALRDQEWSVSQHAANVLGKLGNTSPDVICILSDALHDQDQYVRQSAAEALVQLGNISPDVIRILSDALRDQEWSVSQHAANVLGKLGNTSPDVICILSDALHDQDPYVRQRAADTLVQLSNASPDVIRALSDALSDQEWYVRQSAADALGKLGNPSTDVIYALAEALRDQDQDVRQRAADALGKLGNASPDIIRALSDALRDQYPYVRQSAADALGKLGNASPDVIHALSESLRDQDQDVRQRAADVLGKLGNASPDVIRALSDALCDREWDVRQSAAEALGKLGNASPDIIRALSDALRDQDPYVSQSAADALGKLGDASPDVIRALSNALRDQYPYVRQSAADALGKLGNASPDVIRALSNALRDREWDVRQSAAGALERIGFDSPAFCEGMRLLLSDPDPELQKMALRSIGYPSTDPGLLNDLKTLTESENPEIREAAEDAYRKYKFKLEMLGLLPA